MQLMLIFGIWSDAKFKRLSDRTCIFIAHIVGYNNDLSLYVVLMSVHC